MQLMTKTNGERMAVLETKVDNLDHKLDEHTCDQKADFKTMFDKIDALSIKLDCADSRFAGKWVEKISVGILVTVIAGAITFLIFGI